MRMPNEDLVLESFYQQRQTRSKTPKRHSLLQRNVSFFSNSQKTDENAQPISTKSSQRKKNLEEYQRNFRALTQLSSLNKSAEMSKNADLRDSKFELLNKYTTLEFKPNKYLHHQDEFEEIVGLEKTYNIVNDSETFRKRQKEKSEKEVDQQDYFSSQTTEREQGFSSPNFRMSSQIAYSPEDLNKLESPVFMKGSRYESKEKEIDSRRKKEEIPEHTTRQRQLEQRLFNLREQLLRVEKQNRKQAKFIDSIQKMRKTVEKTEEECNLKQLWRWVKKLPNRD